MTTKKRYASALLVATLASVVLYVDAHQREAQALAQLAHDNVVRFYSFEREGLLAFIVMDYVEGVALDRVGGFQTKHADTITRSFLATLKELRIDNPYVALRRFEEQEGYSGWADEDDDGDDEDEAEGP